MHMNYFPDYLPVEHQLLHSILPVDYHKVQNLRMIINMSYQIYHGAVQPDPAGGGDAEGKERTGGGGRETGAKDLPDRPVLSPL